MGTLPDPRQHTAPRRTGQIQVEQHQVGAQIRGCRLIHLVHILKRGFSVFHYHELYIQIVFFESAAHQKYISGIILSQQNCNRRACCHQYPPPAK